MQHAVALSGEEDEQKSQTAAIAHTESGTSHPTTSQPMKQVFSYTWSGIKYFFHLLRPSTIRSGYNQLYQMTLIDLIKMLFFLLIKSVRLFFMILLFAFRYTAICLALSGH